MQIIRTFHVSIINNACTFFIHISTTVTQSVMCKCVSLRWKNYVMVPNRDTYSFECWSTEICFGAVSIMYVSFIRQDKHPRSQRGLHWSCCTSRSLPIIDGGFISLYISSCIVIICYCISLCMLCY